MGCYYTLYLNTYGYSLLFYKVYQCLLLFQPEFQLSAFPLFMVYSAEADLPCDIIHDSPRVRIREEGHDTSILHHVFISIFIPLWAVTTHYISILMAILSYFRRFTMKRGNAGSWNSGWKRSKHWKPILHCSKNPETPWNLFLQLVKIIERKKHLRGPTPWPGGWGARPPLLGTPPYLLGPLVAPRCPSSPIWGLLPWKKSWASLRDKTPPPRGGTLAEPI